MLETFSSSKQAVNVAGRTIGRRAAKELKPDDIVNIGIGIPENVVYYARKDGILDQVTLTVESGGIGGFPASGTVFGAVIGATCMVDMANQFDLYDNGGLDICFMGALEVDRFGNVNSHRGPGAFAGIGGFANITAKTPTVVFCMTFNAKGLDISRQKDKVTINANGTIPKFVNEIKSISFSVKRALENKQRVIYVTERCVFELTPNGLKLTEVYPGVDIEKDVLNLLPFPVELDEAVQKKLDKAKGE
jgi:propionate CoA-transferase